jgi:acyl-CoA thioesterase-1
MKDESRAADPIIRQRIWASIGSRYRRFHRLLQCVALLALAATGFGAHAEAKMVKLVALGDSLTAGYQLPAEAAFPAVLERALRAEGYLVKISNAGVSGDTASGGLARLDWALGDGADGVILELGGNDMLRGMNPKITRAALDTILERLASQNIKVLIVGMKASSNLGSDYKARFDAIYPELAEKYGAIFYPHFLDVIESDPRLRLADGMHPNEAGIEQMVERLLPTAKGFLDQLGAKAGAQR